MFVQGSDGCRMGRMFDVRRSRLAGRQRRADGWLEWFAAQTSRWGVYRLRAARGALHA